MLTQFMNSGYRKPEKWAVSSKRPFHVHFINENASDAGGPMRDAIGNLCVEIMSGVLPLLRPTSNNLARIEPGMDCYQLNEKSTEPYMLKKFTFLGYFLGWSLRNMGGLAIDLPIPFWRRLCNGSKGYVYTVQDVREFDLFRAEMLSNIKKSAESMQSDEEFSVVFDGYTFEASFDSSSDAKVVELCPNGSQIQLTRANALEFIDLYLKKLTE